MYSLLLVDDERDILVNLATYFPWEESGFVVVGQAETGSEALQILKQQHIDAVLCDIRMPGISGLEFAKTVKEKGYSARIVFLSAYRKFEYAKEAFRYGIRDYLLKPPDFPELMDSLKRVRKELDLEAEEKSGSGGTVQEGPEDPVVRTVSSYVKGNLEHASLHNAAKLVQMNPNYLSTYFKDRFGVSFSEYIMEQRMKKARNLLLDPRYSVQRVSGIVGYANVKNFTRAFRAYFGCPPNALRKGKIIPRDVPRREPSAPD